MKNTITLLKVKSYELMLQQLKEDGSADFDVKLEKINKELSKAARSGGLAEDAAAFIEKSNLLKTDIMPTPRKKKTTTKAFDKANLSSDAWTAEQIQDMYKKAIAEGTLI